MQLSDKQNSIKIFIFVILFLTTADFYAQTIVKDQGFEKGHPNPFWIEKSIQYSSIICNAACSPLSTVVPFDSNYFALLGGSKNLLEEGSVEQNVTIPVANSATLEFYLKTPVVANNIDDYFSVLIDSVSVFSINAADSQTYKLEYKKVSIDISAYADGKQHNLKFFCHQTGVPRVTYYLVDNVNINTSSGFDIRNFAKDILIFPNPAKSIVNISGLVQGDYNISVFSIDGKQAMSKSIKRSVETSLDISKLPKGFYMLSIEDKNGAMVSRKLLIY